MSSKLHSFLHILANLYKSRDRSVGLATGYELEDRMIGVRFLPEAGNFSLHHRVQTGSGVHSAAYTTGTGGFSLWVKQPGREADHSPPSSAEVVELYVHSSSKSSWCGA
jgi:hypothetical protein